MSDDFVRRLRERVDASVPAIPVETALVVPRARRRRAVVRSVGALAVLVVLSGAVWTAGAVWPGRTAIPPIGVDKVMPSPVPAEQRAGLFGVWKVTADGEGTGTFLKLDGSGQAYVWRDCGVLDGAWAVGPTRFVGYVYGWSDACGSGTSSPSLPWLDRAASYRAQGDGWQLLDAQGAVVATLRHDGAPASRPDVSDRMAEPPVVDDAARARVSDPARLPAGVTPVTSDLIVGRWVATGAPVPNNPYVEFSADGRWSGSDGCNEAGGRWATDLDGRLLVVGGASTAMLCDGAPLPDRLATARRAAYSGGGELLLFDNDGAQLAQLRRGGPDATASPSIAASVAPTPTATPTVATETAPPTTAPAPAAWQLSGAGIGPIRLGRTLQELAGDPAVKLDASAVAGAPCLARFVGTPGYQVAVEFAGAPGTDPAPGAVVTSVSALGLGGTSAIPVLGRSGVTFGSSAAAVEAAYPGGTWPAGATTYSLDRIYTTADGSVPMAFGFAGDALVQVMVGRADFPLEFCG